MSKKSPKDVQRDFLEDLRREALQKKSSLEGSTAYTRTTEEAHASTLDKLRMNLEAIEDMEVPECLQKQRDARINTLTSQIVKMESMHSSAIRSRQRAKEDLAKVEEQLKYIDAQLSTMKRKKRKQQ